MLDRHIRALTPEEADRLRTISCIWRAIHGGRVKHCFTEMGRPLMNGNTLCGKSVRPLREGDYRNIFSRDRCPVCARKKALIDARASAMEE